MLYRRVKKFNVFRSLKCSKSKDKLNKKEKEEIDILDLLYFRIKTSAKIRRCFELSWIIFKLKSAKILRILVFNRFSILMSTFYSYAQKNFYLKM